MRWTERQRAMLREMGIEIWSGPDAAVAAADEAEPSALPEAVVPEAVGDAWVGSGHPHAHWMLVVDAPDGSADGADGFGGRAGVLLDNMLRALELTRAEAAPSRQVHVTCVAACAPEDGRPEEAARCAELLLNQLQQVQPRVIVTMGRVAAQTLLHSRQPLGQLRGRLHQHGGIPLICTYHPAYLLRNPEDKAHAWEDLCLAVQALQGKAPA